MNKSLKRLLIIFGLIIAFLLGYLGGHYSSPDSKTQEKLKFYSESTQTLLNERKNWIETVLKICPETDRLANELSITTGKKQFYQGCENDWLEKAKNLPTTILELTFPL